MLLLPLLPQGHFQIMFNRQHCPLFQPKLSLWMRILYSSAALHLPPCSVSSSKPCCLHSATTYRNPSLFSGITRAQCGPVGAGGRC